MQKHFRQYTIENGLSNNAVYSIFQDSGERMWFGTIDGLHCFDGQRIKPVKCDDQALSPGSIIYAIAEDSTKTLWIASDKGISLYSLKKGLFVPFNVKAQSGEIIKGKVSDVYLDSKGVMWICTAGQGVFTYNIKSQVLTQYTTKELPTNYIIAVTEDKAGIIWITTLGKGLCKYDYRTGKFTNYSDPFNNNGSVVYEDSKSNLWMGTTGNGLFLFNRQNLTYKKIIVSQGRYNLLQIRDMVEYTPGVLSIGSDNGIINYYTGSGKAELVKEERGTYGGLNDNYIHSLYVDKERGLWVGTYFGGVNYLSPTRSNFSYYSYLNSSFTGKVISAFAKDERENLWIGTDDAGFSYWNRSTGQFKTYIPSKQGVSPTYRNIHALLPVGDKLYIGMYMGGLDVLDIKTGRFTNYNTSDSPKSLWSSGVYAIFKDLYGTIWIGTTGGLNKLNEDTNEFERIEQVSKTDIASIIEDKEGNLWVCTLGNGLFKLDRKSNTWRNYLHQAGQESTVPANRVITACLDYNNDLWFGTDGAGICKYEPSTDRFIKYLLPAIPSNVIYKMIPDNDFLWISTSNGLIKWQPGKDILKIYDKYDGLQDNQFSPNAGVKMADGTIYFGGINGFNGFKPAEMVQNSRTPKLMFTDFLLYNKSLTVLDYDSPLNASISYTDKIVLHRRHNIFSLDFALLSYTGAQKNSYQYKLEGFEKEWTTVTGIPRATYTNLPAGKYVFRVKGANGDGVWNKEGLSLSITVMPPLLLSTTFFIGYILILLVVIGLVFYYFQRKIREQHRQKLREEKINFFTNMVHEIRTPLTLILAPLEHVMRSSGKISDVLPQLQIIEKNGQRLLSLVNQLMDFRKIEGGGIEVVCSNIDITLLVEDIYKRFKLSADIKNIKTELILPQEPCIAFVDKEAFTKILSNLLSNALKFTKNEILVSLLVNHSNGQISLTIQDNGLGISAKEQDNIFKPFYQIKDDQPSDYIGTGIGLIIVKKLLDMLNGELELISTPGEGSRFIIKFKLAHGVPAVMADNTQSPSNDVIGTQTAQEKVPERVKLLVIDDNTDMRNFIKELLLPQYDVECACDGVQGLQMLEQYHADMIISDIMMPNMDGYQFCSIVKNNIETSHIPIILLTAKVETDDKIAGLETGADAYIEKPFSSELLITQISNLLFNRARLRNNYLTVPSVPLLSMANSKTDEKFLEKIQQVIEANMTEPNLSVEFLARELGMGRSNFFVKVKGISGVTPNDSIRIARLKRAAQFFMEGETSVSEVCYRVGFSSPSYFAKCFQQQFQVTPADYIKNIKQKI
ncbi:MAG: two-component regulator propeller domain-containing protein [Bacteroidales bacterium]